MKKSTLALGLASTALVGTTFAFSENPQNGEFKDFSQRISFFQNLTEDQKSELQNLFQNRSGMNARNQNDKHQKGGMGKKGPQMRMENVERSTEKIANGIVETRTTTDEATLEKLHQSAENFPQPRTESESISVEKLSNGIRITRTSTDTDRVEKMHERADQEMIRQSIKKSVENLSNGVRITLTSDNADAVEHLKSQEERAPKRETINHERTELSNGIQITITSEDAEEVEKIQEHATKQGPLAGGPRGGKKRGDHGPSFAPEGSGQNSAERNAPRGERR
jgi:vacuolar-type H+-ATPase subunit I/STV1